MSGRQVLRTAGREDGLTLIEVAVTVMVIGILSALATVSYLRYAAHWDLVTTARILAADIRETRDQAMREGEEANLWLYEEWDYYERRSSTGEVCKEVYLPERVRFAWFRGFDKPDLEVGTAVYELHFAYTGNPSRAGTIFLESTAGESKKVIVTPVTGRVRVE